jgi:anti-sigma-K factor RskA
MNCNELRDHYELYALGVAAEPERTEIREHLNRNCEDCMVAMKRAREFSALLSGAAVAAAPSPKLRRRILASIGVESRRSYGWAPWLGAAATLCFFAAFYFGGRERTFANEVLRLREQMRSQTIELTRLNEAFGILNGANTTETTFGQGPKGKVFINPNRGVLLIASNLPQTQPGKVYEMWIISKAGKAVRAGEFQSEADGTAMHLRTGPVDRDTTGAVAVTLENQGGADQPTSTPLIVAPLQ